MWSLRGSCGGGMFGKRGEGHVLDACSEKVGGGGVMQGVGRFM